jgi:hypothetical protein
MTGSPWRSRPGCRGVLPLVLALLLGWALLAPVGAGATAGSFEAVGSLEAVGADRVGAAHRPVDAGFAVLSGVPSRAAAVADGRDRPSARARSAAGQPGAILTAGPALAALLLVGTAASAAWERPGGGRPADRPARAPPVPSAVPSST